jgi:CRISPR/Cas system-associated exonuclease Cas4 (RecB family)
MTATALAAAAAPPCQPAVSLDHLSWSSLKTYSTCPRRFAYRYIEQVPEEFTAASLAFGSAFHTAVDAIHQSRIEGACFQSADIFMRRYSEAWSANVAESPVQFAKGEDAITLHDTASRMLAAYLEYLATQSAAGTIIAIEESLRFHLLLNVPPLEMRLDLLELTPDGDLIVSDLKTSRSRWNEEKAREHLPQLVLYANGLMPLLRELGAKRIVPRFVVVTKAKKPAVQVLEPVASQNDVTRLKEQVADTWTAIQAGVFVKRESWACQQCPYRKRCLG